MNNFFSPDFYIVRDAEINTITKGLSVHGIVAITGQAGVGKTVLSKLYAPVLCTGTPGYNLRLNNSSNSCCNFTKRSLLLSIVSC